MTVRKGTDTSRSVDYLPAVDSLLEPQRLGAWKTVLIVLFFVLPVLMLLVLLAANA